MHIELENPALGRFIVNLAHVALVMQVVDEETGEVIADKSVIQIGVGQNKALFEVARSYDDMRRMLTMPPVMVDSATLANLDFDAIRRGKPEILRG